MSGNNYLLDTNIVLYLLIGDETLAGLLGTKPPHISFITEMELLGSSKLTHSEERIIRQFLDACFIIEMNPEIKRSAIQIRRKTGLKLPDSIIATTADCSDLSLLTADIEFNKLKSLNILQYKK